MQPGPRRRADTAFEARAARLTTAQAADAVPFPTVLTSAEHGWDSVALYRFRQPPSFVVDAPAARDHSLKLQISGRVLVEGRCGRCSARVIPPSPGAVNAGASAARVASVVALSGTSVLLVEAWTLALDCAFQPVPHGSKAGHAHAGATPKGRGPPDAAATAHAADTPAARRRPLVQGSRQRRLGPPRLRCWSWSERLLRVAPASAPAAGRELGPLISDGRHAVLAANDRDYRFPTSGERFRTRHVAGQASWRCRVHFRQTSRPR